MSELDHGPYQRLHSLENGHSDSISCLSFSPKTDLLASGSEDGTIVLWNTLKGTRQRNIQIGSPITALLWHPSRPRFLVCGSETGVTLYDTLTDQCVPAMLGSQGYAHCIDIDKETGLLAVGVDCDVHIAKDVVDKRFATFSHVPRPGSPTDSAILPRSLHFLSGGVKLITAYIYHGVTCWDVESNMSLWHMNPESVSPIGSTTLSPDCKTIAIAKVQGTIQQFRLSQSDAIQSYFYEADKQNNYPVSVTFLNGNKGIISGSLTGGVFIWATGSGLHQQTLSHEDKLIQTKETSKYSLIAAGNSKDGKDTRVVLWRAMSRTKRTESKISKVLGRLVWLIEDTIASMEHDKEKGRPVVIFFLLASFFTLYIFRKSPWVAIPASLLGAIWNRILAGLRSVWDALLDFGITQMSVAKVWARKTMLEFLEIEQHD
ncbi:WD40-repeat-containing domain protein [Amylostereum chailletii]|nr:WD40-repeat-containing domain protein [Amylostereum chailletii]